MPVDRKDSAPMINIPESRSIWIARHKPRIFTRSLHILHAGLVLASRETHLHLVAAAGLFGTVNIPKSEGKLLSHSSLAPAPKCNVLYIHICAWVENCFQSWYGASFLKQCIIADTLPYIGICLVSIKENYLPSGIWAHRHGSAFSIHLPDCSIYVSNLRWNGVNDKAEQNI